MDFEIFRMERWQSTWEHEVGYNLSESGVEPATLGELLEICELEAGDLLDTPLEYQVSRGTSALREGIAALHPGSGPDDVLVTSGGAESNFLLSWSLLRPGDEVVFTAPNYMQVVGLARNFGAVPVPWPLYEEEGWLPDVAALDELVGDRTRMILVTNPVNPTGSILPEAVLEATVAAADRVGAWIVADEIYRGAELDGTPAPTFWGREGRIVVTSGLSKAYGIPGLRLGWTVTGDRDLVADLWAHKDYTTISMSTLSDRLAAAALGPGPRRRLLERTRGILRNNWPVLETWLAARADVLRWVPPRAGAIAYVAYDLPVESEELAERLRVDADCLVVPGAHFDMERYVRLGFGPREERLRAGLDRCATVLDALPRAA